MKGFTYYDYIKCIHSIRLYKGQGLAEEQVRYQIGEEKKTKNKQDKLVKTIFENKEEVEKLINGFLSPNKKIHRKDLIKYTKVYINKKSKSKDDYIVYKLKNKEIYFLIDYQSKIDNKLPEKILNYSVDIIHEWSKERKGKIKINYPLIVPIVIYLGEEKWKIYNNFKVRNYENKNDKISIEYNLININKISIKKLLDQKSLFGYSMILKKSKSKEELEKNLKLIIKLDKNKKYTEKLQKIIMYYINNVSEETKEKLLKSLKN